MTNTETDLAGEIWKLQGRRAKCAFLLSVLSADGSSDDDRLCAFAALIDDIDRLAETLTQQELGELRSAVDGLFNLPGSWTSRVEPDDRFPASGIDGQNVRRTVVAGGSAASVGRVSLPGAGRYVVVADVTNLGDAPGSFRVRSASDGHNLASVAIDPGYHQTAATTVEADGPIGIEFEIAPAAAGDVWWYACTVRRLEDGSGAAVSVRSVERLSEMRSDDPTSVFTPPTGEPLTLGDIDRLASLRDAFRGERIFVMGNGPSLNHTPLELLGNDYVFGVNRISLLFERVDWRPTFFTAFDVRVVPDNKDEFADLDVPYKFFSARYKQVLGERSNHYWYHTKGFYEGFESAFEPTVLYSGFGGGGTIAVMAVELAYFMGFREIYLIGTDVSYSVPDTVRQSGADHFGDGVKLELESTRDDDANHFDPRYFGAGKKWHNPNVREMKIGFARAASYIERRGGRLRNATVGGELDEVRRVDFRSLF